MKNVLLLLLWSFINLTTFAQEVKLEGRVYDKDNNTPIPFAAINISTDSSNTFFCNADGRFRFSSNQSPKWLKASHPDYKDAKFQYISNFSYKMFLDKKSQTPHPFSQTARHDAELIIQQVLANADSNNFLRQGAYKYDFYEKTKVDLTFTPNMIEHDPDSLFLSMIKSKNRHHLYLLETYGSNTHSKVGKSQTTIKAAKESGLKMDELKNTEIGLNNISLYENNIVMYGERFISPLGKSYKQYFFTLENSYKRQEGDSIYQIAFSGKPNSFNRTLKGRLYISSKNYSIAMITFSYNGVLRKITYYQQLLYFGKKKKWYPIQESSIISLKEYPKKYLGSTITKQSYYSNLDFSTKRDLQFGIILFDNFNEENEEFWELKREENLTETERLSYLTDYQNYDGSKLKKWYKISKAFYKNELAFNWIGIDLNNLFKINSYEFLRLGIGARTSEKLFSRFSVGAYTAYGFEDQAWKYGGDFDFYLTKNKNFSLGGSYVKDLEEPGRNDYLNTTQSFFRRLFTSRMDILRKTSVDFSGRLNQNIEIKLEGAKYSKENTYDYIYRPEASLIQDNPYKLHFTELNFMGKYEIAGGDQLFGNFSYPAFFINYSKGINTLLDGEFSYSRLSGKVDFTIYYPKYGESSITIEAGVVEPNNPYPVLFNGRGGKNSIGYSSGIFIKDAFQTMDLYGFVTNKFTNIFVTHNFKKLIPKEGKFKPELGIAFNAGWGVFDGNKEDHVGITFEDYSKGFYETGLLFNNLLKSKILGLVKGGLGVAFYYTVGPYAEKHVFRNTSVRFTYVVKSI
ncbi:DUF5686 family protein [Flammeovirgaceae bacterium SG7u.111]|nr:DUF5686 family protein [Flammeovirgaceae bacterium SG7u.132]WPO35562.1 DUF5686 family protein [Flammeovirgaceae bacterium SG7u.111]